MRNRVISAFLAVVMMLSLITSLPVFAASDSATVSVQSVSETAGSLVDVNVVIENNPGILGATFQVEYDDGLTLMEATNGEAFSVLAMTPSASLASPCKFVWDGQDITSEDIKDGVILKLQFKISDDAVAGDVFNVNISYKNGTLFDANLDPIDVGISNGYVAVINYVPGDLDENKEVNSRDIIMLRRHIAGGYELEINEAAADVDNSGDANSRDIILIRRYIAGGYGVELVPSAPRCEHEMTEHPYKAPDFENSGNIAYWSCSKCNKLFSDENGTTVVSENDIVISPLEGYSITYYVDNNDGYLQSLTIENPNPAYYSTEEGTELLDLMVGGYNFDGWYTTQTGGERVTKIEPGETGNKIFYARWEKLEYTISFASDMVPQESIVYSVGEEKPLPKPTLDKYTFVGWSDKEGTMWETIPAGMSGNITLYANWASNRNKAVAKATLSDPIICEDSQNGVILFTYEIGEIQNVPLFTMFKLNCANGIISSTQREETDEILESQAKSIASTISKATTDSASWTLSKDWNNSTEISKTYLEETGQTQEVAETLAKSASETYNLTNSNGSSNGCTNTSSGAFKLSGNKSHSDSTTTETGQNFGLSVDGKYSYEASAGLKAGIPGVGDAEVGVKSGFEIGVGADYSNYGKTSNTGTDSWSNTVDISNENSKTYTAEKTWNTSQGFSKSSDVSKSNSVSNAISSLVSEQYGYGSSYAEGGSNSESKELSTTDSKSDEYSAAITYNSSKIVSTRTEYSSTGNTVGDYRLVMAGKVHVFAVIGYDIATNSYFTYTYNVMDDETEEYLDYSFDGTFNDYETSIIPFEIPYFVNEYVNNRIAITDGFKFDPDTGMIVGYTPTGEEADTVIVIPSYISVDNNDDTFKAVKVTGIKEGLFKDNTDIVAVQLGNYITEIPDSAFEGCTSLKSVICPNVTKIGDNAFSGCESLSKFTIPVDIEEVGENAFANVPEINATAKTAQIAKSIAESGARSITLDISSIPDNDSSNIAFEIGEIDSFELQGKDKEYKGLSVKSNAAKTTINGITFTENTKVPLELTSPEVVLDRVTVDCTGYASILKAEDTNLHLNRTVNLLSKTGNAVVSKNVTLASLSSSIVGKLNVTGNVLTSGNITDDEGCLTITDGEIKSITAEEFENYINSHKVSFDANGGTVSADSRMVAMNSPIGELPVPSKDYYTFDGWYTAASGGDEVTAETIMTSLTDITLYAHWVQNDVSAWTLASNVPSDAEIVDRKWTYTLTSYTTSSSSSLSGWTRYDSTRTSWSKEYGPVYSDPSGNGRSVRSEKYVTSSNYKTQYHYYRYANSACATYGSSKADYKYLYTYTYDSPLTKVSGTTYTYKLWCSCGISQGYHSVYSADLKGDSYTTRVWVSDNYGTRWYYKDPIYTYYFKKTTNKESSSYPSGANISNIKEYVQYRTK